AVWAAARASAAASAIVRGRIGPLDIVAKEGKPNRKLPADRQEQKAFPCSRSSGEATKRGRTGSARVLGCDRVRSAGRRVHPGGRPATCPGGCRSVYGPSTTSVSSPRSDGFGVSAS